MPDDHPAERLKGLISRKSVPALLLFLWARIGDLLNIGAIVDLVRNKGSGATMIAGIVAWLATFLKNRGTELGIVWLIAVVVWPRKSPVQPLNGPLPLTALDHIAEASQPLLRPYEQTAKLPFMLEGSGKAINVTAHISFREKGGPIKQISGAWSGSLKKGITFKTGDTFNVTGFRVVFSAGRNPDTRYPKTLIGLDRRLVYGFLADCRDTIFSNTRREGSTIFYIHVTLNSDSYTKPAKFVYKLRLSLTERTGYQLSSPRILGKKPKDVSVS